MNPASYAAARAATWVIVQAACRHARGSIRCRGAALATGAYVVVAGRRFSRFVSASLGRRGLVLLHHAGRDTPAQ